MKNILFSAVIASALGTAAQPAISAGVLVREAPPAPRAEQTPAPRRGHIWTPGHWEWKHQRHVWTPGKWLRERSGYVYNAPDWEERNGRWRLRSGNWAYARHRGNTDSPRSLDGAGPGYPTRY